MNSKPIARLGLGLAALALSLGFVPTAAPAAPAFAQSQDFSVNPQSASLTAADLRPGFTLDPSKTETREPVPGITVYEADFTRPQTSQNFKDGPIEIKSLVARTPSSQQAAEQLSSSRQALVTASPAWTESKVAKLGDEAVHRPTDRPGLVVGGNDNRELQAATLQASAFCSKISLRMPSTV